MLKKRDLYHNLSPKMSCVDYTVSNESYELLKNEEYKMLVTLPVPIDLENYYKSEDYISHTNSKKSILDKVYQRVRKHTLQKKLTLINSFNTNQKNILDVGAGTGDFLNVCKNNDWNVSGVEPSLDARSIAQEKGIHLSDDIFSLKEDSFDVITLWHVLEHVKDLQKYINQLQKLLKRDGVIVVAVPNFNSYDANHYKEFWAAFDVPRHLWHFSQYAIKNLFNDVFMKVVDVKPMLFDSYYVSLLSEKYKNGSSNFLKAFYIGCKSNFKAKKTSEYSSLIYIIKNG